MRPIWNEEMMKELAGIILQIVIEWDGEKFDDDDYWRDKILKARIDPFSDNAYEVAKKLEWDMHISPDGPLVDELENVYSEASLILERHIKQWVKDADLKLHLPLGSRVKTGMRHPDEEGTICALRHEIMTYGVRTPSNSETSHYLVVAEKCELIEP